MDRETTRYQLRDIAAAAADPFTVAEDESRTARQLCAVKQRILTGGYRVVLVAGPSGSCKTGTTTAISRLLNADGADSIVVSMDHFYKNRNKRPLLPDGSLDIESIQALDIGLMNECVDLLTQNRPVELPEFDFIKAERKKITKRVTPTENSVIMIEGLNALNPTVASNMPRERVLRVYLEPAAVICDGDTVLMDGRSIRFLRRLVRDAYYRGATAERTLQLWRGVCEGEDRNVAPFIGEADLTPGIFFRYELSVFENLARRLLPASYPDFEEMLHGLMVVFDRIPELSIDVVPKNSLLREFLK